MQVQGAKEVFFCLFVFNLRTKSGKLLKSFKQWGDMI